MPSARKIDETSIITLADFNPVSTLQSSINNPESENLFKLVKYRIIKLYKKLKSPEREFLDDPQIKRLKKYLKIIGIDFLIECTHEDSNTYKISLLKNQKKFEIINLSSG